MAELGVELAERADVVVTMGCGDECPYIPGKRYIDWDLPDPKGRPIAEVRTTRDAIAAHIAELVIKLDAPSTEETPTPPESSAGQENVRIEPQT